MTVKTSAAGIATLEELYPILDAGDMEPGWNKAEPSLWPEPRSAYSPRLWKYEHARAALETAGHLIGTDFAERRNLILFNRVASNRYATARTIVAAYQMIKAGERARSHRHSPNALRLVLEACDGAFTVVDGERIDMRVGDVVLTPGWSWHGHGNDGVADAIWIDFLDVPLVHLLEPMFFEPLPSGLQTVETQTATSPHLFSWVAIDESLQNTATIELEAPSIRTLALRMQRLELGSTCAVPRTTANVVYAVVEGAGHSVIAGKTFEWHRGDVFVVPPWNTQTHAASERATLFSVSDEPVMRMLGFWQTEALA
jgi:gentisate 1,2-dioxygenase